MHDHSHAANRNSISPHFWLEVSHRFKTGVNWCLSTRTQWAFFRVKLDGTMLSHVTTPRAFHKISSTNTCMWLHCHVAISERAIKQDMIWNIEQLVIYTFISTHCLCHTRISCSPYNWTWWQFNCLRVLKYKISESCDIFHVLLLVWCRVVSCGKIVLFKVAYYSFDGL